MKNKLKYLSIIITITLISIFFVGCASNKKTNQFKITSQNISEDTIFKTKLEEVKKQIARSIPFVGDEENINNFIAENNERNEVKINLCNFIVEKWNIYLKSGKETVSNNLAISLLKVKLEYPDNKDVEKAYSQYNEYLSKLESKKEDEVMKEVMKEVTEKTNNRKNLTSSDGMLELIDFKSQDGYIIGTIKNNSNSSYRYVEVDINLLDKEGNQVGSTLTNIENLEGFKNWKFKAVVIEENVSSFKIINIKSIK